MFLCLFVVFKYESDQIYLNTIIFIWLIEKICVCYIKCLLLIAIPSVKPFISECSVFITSKGKFLDVMMECFLLSMIPTSNEVLRWHNGITWRIRIIISNVKDNEIKQLALYLTYTWRGIVVWTDWVFRNWSFFFSNKLKIAHHVGGMSEWTSHKYVIYSNKYSVWRVTGAVLCVRSVPHTGDCTTTVGYLTDTWTLRRFMSILYISTQFVQTMHSTR